MRRLFRQGLGRKVFFLCLYPDMDSWRKARNYEAAVSLSSTLARRKECHIHDFLENETINVPSRVQSENGW